MADRLLELGIDPVGRAPQVLADTMAREIPMYAAPAKAANLAPVQ